MTGSSGSKWKCVFDSVQGTSHNADDIPCQDCCRIGSYWIGTEEILVVACADGAGSASLSHEGSEIACDKFLEICGEYISQANRLENASDAQVAEWLRTIRESILFHASSKETLPREFATTLLGCVISETHALFVQIGDGAIVYRGDGDFECAFWPQSGEYANMTNFLTSDLFEEQFEWKTVNSTVNELVVFTDGLERLVLKFEDRSVFAPAVKPLLESVKSSTSVEELFVPFRSFLNSKAVNDRTDDDKTLVLATRLNHDEASV